MKKQLYFIGLFIILSSLFACGQNQGKSQSFNIESRKSCQVFLGKSQWAINKQPMDNARYITHNHTAKIKFLSNGTCVWVDSAYMQQKPYHAGTSGALYQPAPMKWKKVDTLTWSIDTVDNSKSCRLIKMTFGYGKKLNESHTVQFILIDKAKYVNAKLDLEWDNTIGVLKPEDIKNATYILKELHGGNQLYFYLN